MKCCGGCTYCLPGLQFATLIKQTCSSFAVGVASDKLAFPWLPDISCLLGVNGHEFREIDVVAHAELRAGIVWCSVRERQGGLGLVYEERAKVEATYKLCFLGC